MDIHKSSRKKRIHPNSVKFNEIFNEDQFVIMLGGLHIEMAAFKMLGKCLSGSGWVEASAMQV